MQKLRTIYDAWTDSEVEVDIYKEVGLLPGDKVRHAHEGRWAGSSGIIKEGIGTVLDVEYSGLTSYGGNVFVARVQWESGSVYELNISLCIH